MACVHIDIKGTDPMTCLMFVYSYNQAKAQEAQPLPWCIDGMSDETAGDLRDLFLHYAGGAQVVATCPKNCHP
jgi:hypothetical protein